MTPALWAQYREQQGWSYKQAERKTGVGGEVIRRFEKGARIGYQFHQKLVNAIKGQKREEACSMMFLITPKEMSVWRKTASGMPLKQIAHDLVISVKAVEARKANLRRKLGLTYYSDVQLTLRAIREGLVPGYGVVEG